MDLGGNSLIELPGDFSKLTALHTLSLGGGNKLKTLPGDFSKLTALHRLDLGGNKLKTLPDDFSKLKALQELYLADNPNLCIPPRCLKAIPALLELHIDDMQQHRFGSFWDPLQDVIKLHDFKEGRGRERGLELAERDRSEIEKLSKETGVSEEECFECLHRCGGNSAKARVELVAKKSAAEAPQKAEAERLAEAMRQHLLDLEEEGSSAGSSSKKGGKKGPTKNGTGRGK